MDRSWRYLRFRALLRKIREEAQLTQSQLAKKLRKPQTFVSKSELGERRIDFLETLAFCDACGTTAEQFLKRFRLLLPQSQNDKPARRRKKRRSFSADSVLAKAKPSPLRTRS